MRATLLLVALSLAAGQTPEAQTPAGADLPRVRNVYLLPMPNGLEQFVANHLVKRGVLSVVADPKQADAVFTDTVGMGFQQRMEELYPVPKTVNSEEDEKQDNGRKPNSRLNVVEAGQARPGGLSRGKGTIFLVDRKTSVILWSAYVRPKSSSPQDLDAAAKKIVKAIADSTGRGSAVSR